MALQHSPQRHPTTVAVRAALALLIGVGFATAITPQAAVAAESAAASQRTYQIAAGPLNAALSTFAIEAGVSVATASAQVNGLHSKGLQGRYTVYEGFQKLLDGSGLEIVEEGNGNYSLRKAGAETAMATMPGVTVSAQADNNSTEGTSSYTTRAMSTATGLSLSQRQTPQTVSIISRQQMDDFELSSLQDVAQATPGIYSKGQAVSDQEATYFARGFALSHVNVDGLPLDVTGFNERNVSADMIMYDRVEVVRGATGLLEGAGAPSGSINLVRKRPTATPLLNLSAGAGSWNKQQLTVDASNALNDAGTVRGRVAGSWRDSDSYIDIVKHKDATLYGIVEADLAPDTTLGIGFSVQRSRTNGLFVGLPTFADGRHMDLPRSSFFNNADSFQNRDNNVLFADLEQRMEGGWRARFAVTHIDATSNTRNTTNSRIDGEDYLLSQSETGWHYGTRQLVADLRASGPVNWFGRQHDLIIGSSYRHDDSLASQAWENDSDRVIDIRHWNPRAFAMNGHAAPLYAWGRKTSEKGVYAAGNFSLAAPLHLLLGGRFGWYAQDVTGWYETPPTWKRGLEESAKFTPYAGLVYDLDQRHSLYASGTQIFEPQSAIDVKGNTLPPLTGTNYEVGVKGEYFGGALNTSAALFRIEQNNRAMADDQNCPTGGKISCSRAAGQVRSEGVDLQVSGSPLPGWQISAGYTYVMAKYIKDSIASNIGQRIATDEPKHLFKLYTNYQLAGDLSKWNVGGAIYAQDKIYRSDTGFYTSQGTYALLGLTAGYRVNDKLQLRLNVDNLLDRRYYQALGYSWSGGLERYGAPRSIFLSLNYKM
ncbi:MULTISPECIES: TonB-dependent receptor [unclassified Janthinobacterium]|uniref:TonB-dependent siderophore receptor n=1 Tax=unclassified Janthinobacterium TaxID=2610881 RepID=UPI00161F70A8|nr:MULTISPECIES: TonB-dependent receptor [unclassified Janthinobacterium]MBB5610635.1 outer membrane receptor for ferric coprogen and ferric-rhodotorulic acid [Janthinobacterium sp. S3T4]MBB5616121.1 outer membrane receptor for ferric coprogen and ferric-rhodotorulic acid [Janthinobacterium sp. S3M3]